MSRAKVSTEVLNWALRRSGRSIQEAERKLPKIHEWLSGERQPTLRQLEKLASLTATPLGFLFLAEPPEESLPVPYYRTAREEAPEHPSPEMLDTIYAMQRRQGWMRDYLVDQGHEKLPYVGTAKLEDDPESVGQAMRSTLLLEQSWAAKHRTWEDALRALRRAMGQLGIFVVVNGIVGNNTHRKLDPGEFRGFVLVDEHAPFVFVNGADGKAAQMFTLAHELAHVWFGSSAAFDLRQLQPADEPSEKACNRAAAEFLVPASEMRRVWPAVSGADDPFDGIARQFKVSSIVAARRALDLGLIGRDRFFAFYQASQRRVRPKVVRDKKPKIFYETQDLRVGPRFGAAVARAAREGSLLYSEAYRLTGLYGQTFDRYTDPLRIRRA